MAIIQISRIQHRRGLQTDLPQLASAELGWSIDTRRLYIGNGTLEEQAPTLGNTEILTEYSDVLGVAQAYTLKATAGGYTVQTGPSISAPVRRTLQSKLDDIINVRDFGATGDGVTNDLPAINRALYEVFCRQSVKTNSRRTLYFPGGTYKLSGGTMNIPTYANIIGDGINKTIIVQTDSGQDAVAKTADSQQQVDSNISSSPTLINISGMTFASDYSMDLFKIKIANGIQFIDVMFRGIRVLPTSTGTRACIKLESLSSPSVIPTFNIGFNRCVFMNTSIGLNVDDPNVRDVVFNGCYFFNLWQGIKLGELTAVEPRPTAINITNSNFDSIANHAITTFDYTSGIYSINNHYRDVGNTLNGSGYPTAAILKFSADGNYSIGDQFDRPEADTLIYPLIDRGTSTGGPEGLSQGRQTIGTGTTATLADDSTGTIAQFTATNAIVEYTITRGGGYVRTGIIKLTASGYDDEYQETADCGVTLSVATATGVQSLNYATTYTATNAILTYTIKYFS